MILHFQKFPLIKTNKLTGLAQFAGAIKYTDNVSAEGVKSPIPTSPE